MSLETSIDPRLWSAVRQAYEAENYTGAILDSIHFLSDLIRDKSGLDSDGSALVGVAFGGQTPIVKVNSLRTESDRDEQRGIEFLLRGIYVAVRNPRSHEKKSDSVETADVLIRFVNYLASLIDKSKSPFNIEQLTNRVFDPHFVPNQKYAELLASEVPRRKCLEVLIGVFEKRSEGKESNVVLFVQALLKKTSPEERKAFWRTVSEVLGNAVDDEDFRFAIRIAQKNWRQLSEIARLRAENRLIDSIKQGAYNIGAGKCRAGGLGSWASDIAESFTMRNELLDALTRRLESGDPAAKAYVLEFFVPALRALRPKPSPRIVNAFKHMLRTHNLQAHTALFFLEWDGAEKGWVEALKSEYDSFEEAATTQITDDDIPF